MLVTDLGPIMILLLDPHGLGETGEVLVGWKRGDKIRLPLPPREGFRLSEVPAEEFPSLSKGIAGEFGFTRTTDYREHDVLVSYRPLGSAFPDWGLIAKLDSDEAYAPVARLRWLLLSLGGGLLLLGLGASNAIARRVARPIRHLARTSSAVAAGDLSARSRIVSSDELGELSLAFDRMTDELSRSHATLERRISDRTRALEAVRDLLAAFFRISTSRLDPDNIDKTFDSVLRFCSELGYDLAMISLVDREAGVIRAVRANGAMTGVVGLTVRDLDGGDILAVAVREARVIVLPDSRLDPRCDQAAVAAADIRGQVVLPMISDEVLGTLQVVTHQPLDPRTARPPPPGNSRLPHGKGPGRAPADRGDPPPQPEPPAARPGAGAIRGRTPRADPDPPVGPGLHGRRRRRRRRHRSIPGLQPGRPSNPRPGADRRPARRVVQPVRGLPARSDPAVSLGRSPLDASDPRANRPTRPSSTSPIRAARTGPGSW